MKKIIEDLFYSCYFTKKQSSESASIAEELDCLEMNKRSLRKSLNKKQKKLLSRIIDTEERITEQRSLESFINGFKIGLGIGCESNKD